MFEPLGAGRFADDGRGELLGVSERQFRRYRNQYEQHGMAGLVDRRLGKVSPGKIARYTAKGGTLTDAPTAPA